MPKQCKHSECTYNVFGGGYCKYHQGYRTDKKKPKGINPISDKEAKRLAEYRKVRDEYMGEHDDCEVKGCNRESTDLHHKRGRIGSLLSDKRYFMAVCRPCHSEIEENPEWAYRNRYSLKRNGNDD